MSLAVLPGWAGRAGRRWGWAAGPGVWTGRALAKRTGRAVSLALLVGCATRGDSNPVERAGPTSPAAFCDGLTPSEDADAVGVACIDDPAPGQACEEIAVIRVDKGEVDSLCATCEAAGQPCQHTTATNCTTADGEILNVYSFWCGGD